MGNYSVVSPTGAISSLFGGNRFTPFPTGKPNSSTGFAQAGSTNIHNDTIYDISTTNLIDQTSLYDSMQLTAAHFAYLKDLGVYPNNRLMVARRFPGPVGNDLTAIKSFPIATLISWVDNDSDFMDISFGEHWIPAKASFEDVLNSIGKDTTLSNDNRAGNSTIGAKLAAGAALIPLPGLMEGLQQKIFVEMGLAASASNTDIILPVGDPNLIKQGMQRQTIDRGEAGSGLKCDFKIKMKVEYEQKYINGVDPTLAYFDLISNVLSFATSDARFMYTQAFATGTKDILGGLISGDINIIQQTITKFLNSFITVVSAHANKIIDALKDKSTKATSATESPDKITIKDVLTNTLGAIIGKYKIAILGIISSLTGVASTPWHITIGNPLRPYFSSGDMWMDEVSMKMGPVLSWNDLPANITVEFTLKPARNLGAQEIFNRFNTGRARTYQRDPDIASANSNQVAKDDDNVTQQNTAHGAAPVSSSDNTNNATPTTSTQTSGNFVASGAQTSAPTPTTPINNGAAWSQGTVLNKGSNNQQGVKITWKVTQGSKQGLYDATWDLADGGQDASTYNDYGAALSKAKEQASSEFDTALADKGLSPI